MDGVDADGKVRGEPANVKAAGKSKARIAPGLSLRLLGHLAHGELRETPYLRR